MLLIRDYRFREKEHAEQIYNQGALDLKHLPSEIKLLAIYLKVILGLKPKQRRSELYAFCQKNLKGYSRARDFSLINRAMKKSDEKDVCLIQIDCVEVYKGEMAFIDGMDISYDAKKLVFTLLINYKLCKIAYELKHGVQYTSLYFKGGSREYARLKRISNTPAAININTDIIKYLANKNIITIKHKGLIQLNFLEECIAKNDMVAFMVTDYENIGWYYDRQHGVDSIVQCASCDSLIKKTNNKKLYCEECIEERRREQKRRLPQRGTCDD